MFLFGMILIFVTLVFLLLSNDYRKALYIFGLSSIAYFIFGYGVPLNELGSIFIRADGINLIGDLIIIFITMYLIDKFEKTVFISDYELIARSFFFRYEALAMSLYLFFIIFTTGNLFSDFLMIIAVMRLFNVDRFLSYVTTNAILLTNCMISYVALDISELANTGSDISATTTLDNEITVGIIITMLIAIYGSSFLVRRLDKDIKIEWRILAIIAICGIVGVIGLPVLSNTQLIATVGVIGIGLLYINDMNLRKKFSRYRDFPITLSIVILGAFIAMIVLSDISFVFFLIASLLVNAVILNEEFECEAKIDDLEQESSLRRVMITTIIIIIITLLANDSVYNSTQVGVTFMESSLQPVFDGMTHLLQRTFSLYTLAAYFDPSTISLIPVDMQLNYIYYLALAIPALFVLSIPCQVLLVNATKYNTKTTIEITLGVISFGLLLITIISYGTGV